MFSNLSGLVSQECLLFYFKLKLTFCNHFLPIQDNSYRLLKARIFYNAFLNQRAFLNFYLMNAVYLMNPVFLCVCKSIYKAAEKSLLF